MTVKVNAVMNVEIAGMNVSKSSDARYLISTANILPSVVLGLRRNKYYILVFSAKLLEQWRGDLSYEAFINWLNELLNTTCILNITGGVAMVPKDMTIRYEVFEKSVRALVKELEGR